MKREPAKTLKQIEDELNAGTATDKRTEEKQLVVERQPDGMYIVKWTAGGELPDILKGKWTNLARATTAITNFQNAKEA
jgi:hypothetical protein